MLRKLLLILILGMVVAGPATPIFKGLFGIGPTVAHADDNQGNDDNQGDENDDEQ